MKFRRPKRRKSNPWKGLVAGLAGGLAGSWSMNQFQMAYSKISGKLHAGGNGSHNQSQDYRSQQQEQATEDATMKAANRVSQAVLHHDLSRRQKEKLGPAVHYSFGTTMGGVYGAAAELRPDVTAGFGTGFATVLFVAGDEIAVPALRLSGPPTEAPFSSHVYALASHLVYGLAAEGVRRGVRRLM